MIDTIPSTTIVKNLSEKKEPRDIVIYNANAFVDSIHHQKFTELELKVMYWIFTQIKKEDIELYHTERVKKIIIHASELATDLGYENTKSFHHLKILANTIQSKTMSSNLDKGFIRVVIVPMFKYDDGIITLELNHHVLPYLIELKSNYTQFYFNNILKLNSSYAIKLFTLLKQYQSIGNRKFTISDLRAYFAIEQEEYKLYKDFRVRVLKTAIAHINRSADIFVQFKEIKISRKVVEIEFIITNNDSQINQPMQIKQVSREEINQVTQFFLNLASFDKNLAKKIIQFAQDKGNDYVVKAMLYTYTKKPKNPQAYLSRALQNSYGQDIAIGELEHLAYKKIEQLNSLCTNQ
jgi:plasmid replication initiation protein